MSFFAQKNKRNSFRSFVFLSVATCQIWPGVVNTEVGFFGAQFFLMSICNLKIQLKKNPQHPTY
jgi:hypothetical protein